MTLNAFCQEVGELLELQADEVHPDLKITDLPEWSSITFMALIAMVDEEYGVTLSPNTINSAENIAAIFDTIVSENSLKKAA